MSNPRLAGLLGVIPMIGFTADAPKLDVRMGLWETTTTSTYTGAPGMPPEPMKEWQRR